MGRCCRSFKHICRTPGIVQLLTNLSHKYRISPLLRLWFDRLILAAVELRGGATYSSSEGSDGCGQSKPDYPHQLQLALAEIAIDDDLAKYLARWVTSFTTRWQLQVISDDWTVTFCCIWPKSEIFILIIKCENSLWYFDILFSEN